MRLILLLVALISCSCSTQQKFEVTSRSGDVVFFKSVYRPYNVHGGREVHAFAAQARDYTVDSALSEAGKDRKSVATMSLTKALIKYSLSGYYTFTIDGQMSYGISPRDGLIVDDSTDLMATAIKRERRNRTTSMILSPTATLLQDAVSGVRSYPATYRHKYNLVGNP